MPYKVKATHVGFMGNNEKFPCHFDYHEGDWFTYDGEVFEGKVCSGLMGNVVADMMIMAHSGMHHFNHIMFRYHGGRSIRDESFKEYDGIGFRMARGDKPDPDKAAFVPHPGGPRVSFCGDPLTLAGFKLEPVDLASGGYFKGSYMRMMNIMEKLKEDPGLDIEGILGKYNDFELNDIYPQLNPNIINQMLEEMETVGYIEMKDGKAYPLDRKPA
jgi:uncharacterized repeat protein (TIGR04076 family)